MRWRTRGGESETDSSLGVVNKPPTAADITTPPPAASLSTVTGLEAAIKRRVAPSYQSGTKNLYKSLLKSGRGSVNWNAQGQLVLGGKPIPRSDIVELLSDAARPRTKGEPPAGRAEFIQYVRKLNPTLKYIRNKRVYSILKPLQKKSPPKKKKKAQSGEGVRQRIVWHTRL